jgi:hypothetical protein
MTNLVSVEEIQAKVERMNIDVLNVINSGVRTFTDTHWMGQETLHGYALTANGFVCPIFNNTHFSLNDLYVLDNELVLSRGSVAGVVNGRLGIKEGIEFYNKEMKDCGNEDIMIVDYKVF